MKRKKIKEIELPMEFNPGLKKYEPVLPVRKTRKKLKVEADWRWIIYIIVSVILLTGISYFIIKYLFK